MVELMNDLNVQLDNLCQVHLSLLSERATHSTFYGINLSKFTKQCTLKLYCASLVQFLPQDKVQSFAQMTPKQLLEESERALADGKCYRIHQELVEESKLLDNSERVSGPTYLCGPCPCLISTSGICLMCL